MAFYVRLLHVPRFESLTAALSRVAEGHQGAKEELIAEGLPRVDDPDLRGRHAAAEALLPGWKSQLESMRGADSVDLEELARILIPLISMPGYQFSSSSAGFASQNLVPLGENDGGLYGKLRDADAWFDRLFMERFESATERFATDEAMIRLGRDDLEQLQNLLKKPVSSSLDGYAKEARSRLIDLIGRALNDPDTTLAVTVRGH